MNAPAAVLFDLDGTLVDSVPFILACARHALEGYAGGPVDDAFRAGIGTPLHQQMAQFARCPEDVPVLMERYRAYWREHHDRLTHGFPGAVETVAALAAGGCRVGVVTAKTLEGAERTLRHVGLWPHVHAVVGADSCARCKPDPEPIRLALARLSAAPGRAVMVGDSIHDVAAACAAGVPALGVAWGVSPAAALRAAGAVRVLEDIHQLPAALDALLACPAGAP